MFHFLDVLRPSLLLGPIFHIANELAMLVKSNKISIQQVNKDLQKISQKVSETDERRD